MDSNPKNYKIGMFHTNMKNYILCNIISQNIIIMLSFYKGGIKHDSRN